MSFHSRNRRRVPSRNISARQSAAECVEERVMLSAASIDGVGNNLQNPEWGSTNEALLRLANAEYADAISEIGGEDRPSARLISNTVSDDKGQDVISDRLMSAMIYAWGQFIDHDITLSEFGHTEVTSIAVPTGDPSFDPFGTGTATIDTFRSAFDPTTGTDASNPRQQVNQITAFIDGSMVYGSDTVTSSALRTFSGGRLKTSEGNLLPLNNAETFLNGTLAMDNANPLVPSDELFAAGDARANENVELTALQTLFVREHNLQAEKIAKANPKLTDEQIFQKARAIVIAEIQAITYNEWLPSLLGTGAISKYTGYDSTVNPGISNEFATAAFRFGHSLLGDDVEFMDNNGLEIRDGVALSEAFFNPGLLQETGIDSILKYLSSDPSSEVDTKVVDSIRNFLFGPPGAGGLDLASLNIQRGRDHGLADYNTVRESIGLPRVTSFAEITSDTELQSKLQSLYGSVDDMDLWVAGLAEDHVAGSSVGETFQAIIVDQFERLRDGDRFWYQNQFSGKELAQLQKTSLSDIIERNTSLTSIQQNAFFFKASISGTITQANNSRSSRSNRSALPLTNANVSLINTDDGSTVATTTTDSQGRYSFSVAEGLRTGIYRVSVTGSDGTVVANSRNISITGGDDFEHVNLSVSTTVAATPKTPAPKVTTPPKNTPPRQSTPAMVIGRPANQTGSSGSQESGQSRQSPTGLGQQQSQSVAQGGSMNNSKPKQDKTASTSSKPASNRNAQSSQAAVSLKASQLHSLIDSLFAKFPAGLQ